jgi:hypothetical protein
LRNRRLVKHTSRCVCEAIPRDDWHIRQQLRRKDPECRWHHPVGGKRREPPSVCMLDSSWADGSVDTRLWLLQPEWTHASDAAGDFRPSASDWGWTRAAPLALFVFWGSQLLLLLVWSGPVLLGRHCTLWATPPACFALLIFQTGPVFKPRPAELQSSYWPAWAAILFTLLHSWDDRHVPLCPAFIGWDRVLWTFCWG